MIQDKLNTPTNSTEDLTRVSLKNNEVKEKPVQKPPPEEKPVTVVNKPAPYRPPSINLSTWSERPKTQVSLKEDTDYRIKSSTDTNNSKVIINTVTSISQNNHLNSYGTNNNNSGTITTQADNNVSIKVNGTEPIVSQNAGNLIIKIGTNVQTNETFFRKPLGNISVNEVKSRPHSIAIDSTFDVSRVPIVRSVELKKPYKDSQMNKSVTQIYNSNNEVNLRNTNETDNFYKQPSYNGLSEHRRSSETLNGSNGFQMNGKHHSNFNDEMKPVVRVNTFAPPTVRGFRTADSNGNVHRKTWNTPSPLPSKIYVDKEEDNDTITNKNVPFSQSVLKRRDSGLNSTNNNNANPYGNVVLRNTSQNSIINNNYRNSIGSFPPIDSQKQPPPPPMPKITNFAKKPQRQFEPEVDPRDQLLSAIRNFGGKKGLKAVKA